MKEKLNRFDRWFGRLVEERGSALLVSLMVIVGLSLLGLGFVAVSETESSIAVNEKNHEQTLANAEAGAKFMVDVFQSPAWANTLGLLPANDDTFKVDRWQGTSNVGKYKPNTGTQLLFDLPFKPIPSDRLFGDENHADIVIDDTTTTGKGFLDTFNTKLFPTAPENGYETRVNEIKVYAPTMVGAVLNSHGFYEGGDRYGVATLKVTAIKTNKNVTPSQIVAIRFTKVVLTEFPFPGPNGPIQSNSSLSITGSAEVYWGEISSHDDLKLFKVGINGMPWVDATHTLSFEHGYDSSTEWKASTGYFTASSIVHPSAAAIGPSPLLAQHAFTPTTNCTSGATEPVWNIATAGASTTGSGTCTWTERAATSWPLWNTDASRKTDSYDWLSRMVTESFPDLWAQARSRAHILDCGCISSTSPIGNIYNDPTLSPNGSTNYNWFQMQTKDESPDYQIVDFPYINYDFWKGIALAGDGQPGIHYFVYDTAHPGNFYQRSDPSTYKPFTTWVNSSIALASPAEAGFYFFDTANGQNPQNGGPGTLTPNEHLTSAIGQFAMRGFIYLNSTDFDTKGLSGDDQLFNAPGEPFKDVGYRAVDASGKFVRDVSGNIALPVGVANGAWDYQDVNSNGKFDLILKNVGGVIRSNGVAYPPNTYIPAYYYEGCTVGSTATGGCSEPFEPYLNVLYPQDTGSVASSAPTASTMGWACTGATAALVDGSTCTQLRLAKKTSDALLQTAVDCTVVANQGKCTSNLYDDTGPVCHLKAGSPPKANGAILIGVFYNEGTYTPTGNATYYGSILIQGGISVGGTPSVWFDESLKKGDFKKKFPNFPRVFISAQETDQQ